MQVTRIKGASLPEALAQARAQLGPRAIVLSQEVVAGGVELVVAIERDSSKTTGLSKLFKRRERAAVASTAPAAPVAPAPPRGAPAAATPVAAHSTDDINGVDRPDSPLAAVRRVLLKSGLGDNLTDRFGRAARAKSGDNPTAGELAVACESAMKRVVRLDPYRSLPKYLFLFGPSGSGKTSSALRLVAREMNSHPTVLAQIDDGRELWRTDLTDTCNRLGVPYVRLTSIADLEKLVRDSPELKIVFDTGGLVRSDRQRWDELIEYRETVPTAEAIGLLPAGFSENETEPFMDFLAQLSPTGMALTRMDEAGTIGHLLRAFSQRDLPIAFTSHGRGLLKSWEPATYRNLTAVALRPLASELSQ